jgi:hypothetical protein
MDAAPQERQQHERSDGFARNPDRREGESERDGKRNEQSQK